MICSVEGCTVKFNLRRGWCRNHYQRWYRYGDPLAGKPSPLSWPLSLLARMAPQVNGCVRYTGGLSGSGYGHLKVKGRQLSAHRAAYELLVGPISEGMTIDHLCRNRWCVSPVHLEVVTQAENNRRKDEALGRGQYKTHCANGHEFTEATTYQWRGERSCRTCRRAASQRHRHPDDKPAT